MDILSIILIAIGLAMDCLAVSISKGICVKKFYPWPAFKMALMFGLFQGFMPLIAYFAGISFADIISRFDHWIAFGLLLFIGGKMIIESLSNNIEDKKDANGQTDISSLFSWKTILLLAIATSIDALATGLIFVPYPSFILKAVVIIGVTSMFFSLAGMIIGVSFGKRFKLNVNLIGGIILVFIGTKILIEHLFFS